MTLKSRIYLIVALMSLMICAVGGVAMYFTSAFSERVQRMENASARAFAGEHLNRLVTAVVMDARGIYASTSTEQAKPFADGIMASLDKIDAHLDEWRNLIPADERADFDKVVARTAEFRTFRAETARLGTIDPAQANTQGNNDANRANRKAYQAEIDAVVSHDQTEYDQASADLDAFQAIQLPAMLGLTALSVLLAAASASFVATRYVSRPISRVTSVMGQLADGDYSVEVPYAGERNEIGSMAAAVQVFKDNGIRVAAMNEDERQRHEKAAERARMMERFQTGFDGVSSAPRCAAT